MKQSINNLSKKYFYFLCFFFLLTNNAYAVKSEFNPAQKLEVKSDSTSSELIFTHRSNQRSPKRIKAGQKVKVRTKNKKTYRGELKVIDERYIEVGGEKIALENIVKIKHRYKRNKMIFGIGFIATLVLLGLLSVILFQTDEYVLGIILGVTAVMLVPIGLLILLLPVIFTSRVWKFKIKKKDDVLYRRDDS